MRTPGKELSDRLLGSVSYKDRFPAGRLMPLVGVIPGHVRSLRELHLLLAPDVRSLPGLNLPALADWVERAVGDQGLAEAVRAIIQDSRSYAESCLALHDLIGLRLGQARAASEPVMEFPTIS